MSISHEDVVHVARLARLELTEEEITLFAGQLGGILDHAAQVKTLDLAAVEPTAHPVPLANVLRADTPRPCLAPGAALAAAPASEDGRFRVPPILDLAEGGA